VPERNLGLRGPALVAGEVAGVKQGSSITADSSAAPLEVRPRPGKPRWASRGQQDARDRVRRAPRAQAAGARRSVGAGARELRLEAGQRDDQLTEKLRQEISRAVTEARELADEPRPGPPSVHLSAAGRRREARGGRARAFVTGVLLSAAANLVG